MIGNDEVTLIALCRMVKATGNPVDRKSTALALRLAAQHDPQMFEVVLTHALAVRAEWRVWITRTQRDWQTKVSRRPQRGRHHDSWSIRESYVRCSNGGGQ